MATATTSTPASVGGGGSAAAAATPSAAPSIPQLDPANKEEILRVFQSMTQQRDALTDKLSELLYSHSEYKCVLTPALCVFLPLPSPLCPLPPRLTAPGTAPTTTLSPP
jgi:hypothetical protein